MDFYRFRIAFEKKWHCFNTNVTLDLISTMICFDFFCKSRKPTATQKSKDAKNGGSPRHTSGRVDPKQLNSAGENNTGCDLAEWDWSFGLLVWHSEQRWRNCATDTSSMTGHRCRITGIREDSWRMRKRRQRTKQMSDALIWIAIKYFCLICNPGQANAAVWWPLFFFYLDHSVLHN